MATSITAKFLNQDKREIEALTVTLPSMIDEGGGRTQTAPTYLQGGEEYVASVAPQNSIVGKSYLVIEEAFPASSTVTIRIAGQVLFTAAPITATGLTVSTLEDIHITSGGIVSITIAGVTGDITSGKLRLVSNYTPYTVKNGRYSDVPTV